MINFVDPLETFRTSINEPVTSASGLNRGKIRSKRNIMSILITRDNIHTQLESRNIFNLTKSRQSYYADKIIVYSPLVTEYH